MKEPVSISTDKSKLDIELIHEFLANSYWAEAIPMEVVKKSIENSICFGVYEDDKQIGFARVISDMATFAYLGDVFIIPDKQGHGLGKQLLDFIFNYHDFKGLRRWHLVTQDAQELYKKFGFTNPNPAQHMEKRVPDIYKNISVN